MNATEKQVSYLVALRDGKDLSSLTSEQIEWLTRANFADIPKNRASDVIEKLKVLPWMPRRNLPAMLNGNQPTATVRPTLPDVADGRYAILEPDIGTLRFYSVKKGRHDTFVDVWASDNRWPVRDINKKYSILKAIEADPDAGPRFGREIGKCYVCGRTLTDDVSRALGIGPICRGEIIDDEARKIIDAING